MRNEMYSPLKGLRLLAVARQGFFIIFTVCLFSLGLGPPIISADTTAELQAKIDQRNADIQILEKEISGYQNEINALGSQASSLRATVKSLDLTQKKLAADIALTQGKIEQKNLIIEQLSTDITGKEKTITYDRNIISQSLTLVQEVDNQSLPSIFLSSASLSDAWNSLDDLGTLENNIVSRINELRQAKADLEHNKTATQQAKADLDTLKLDLNNQRKVVLTTQAEKNQLLKETRLSESQYQTIVVQKRARKDAFERELLSYESQLKTQVDLSKLPHTGSGVLSWPLDQVSITQYFGNTPFATANPQIYNGLGHTGIDLRASIGTPVKAALSGIVSGVGNTDLIPGCYSYGKWIMIKHADGLSTLYAHLSLPGVTVGQIVATGQLLGYSGNTGYTTGPHLHFGVYATQGVQITTFQNSRNCNGALIPLASFNAYLNPLSYL